MSLLRAKRQREIRVMKAAPSAFEQNVDGAIRCSKKEIFGGRAPRAPGAGARGGEVEVFARGIAVVGERRDGTEIGSAQRRFNRVQSRRRVILVMPFARGADEEIAKGRDPFRLPQRIAIDEVGVEGRPIDIR